MPATASIRYARSGDVDVAYQVIGDGPIDLVFVQGSITHLQLQWEWPPYRRFLERLGEFTRVITFDKRGMGMSDRVPGTVPLEERMDDVRMVMDAVGSERAVLMGESEGGPLSILFAAAHPERTQALILQGAEVRERKDDDWPWGESTPEELERALETLPGRWGRSTAAAFAAFLPGQVIDDWTVDLVNRIRVNAATPSAAAAFFRMAYDIDVRDVAPTIRVPTLILHAVDDPICHVENARWLARHIEGARYVELPGADHLAFFSEADRIIGEIREFLTGQRAVEQPETRLVTLLFIDVVGSTERLVAVGDARWADILERYHAIVRNERDRHRGTEVDVAGDGFLLAFDGPARAIRAAEAVSTAVRSLGIEIRAGLHAGELGFVGGKPVGIAVHLGARIAAVAGPGEILVSSTVRDLVSGSGIRFADRGRQALKGIPDEVHLFAVEPG